MARKRTSPKQTGRTPGPLGPQSRDLVAENKQLKQRTQQLEVECAMYRDALRALITSRYTADDLRRITEDDDESTYQPLKQFVGELETIVKGKRKKGA